MNIYLKIAHDAIDQFINSGKVLDITDDIAGEMLIKRSGVFVSIYNKNILRGCIGTYVATKDNIAQEIIFNAIAACSKDYRFSPISSNELATIKLSIDIINTPELITDITQLDPDKFGILIKSRSDSRTGVLLPNISSVTTIHDQIAIALNKADLKPQDQVDIYRFTVTRYKD